MSNVKAQSSNKIQIPKIQMSNLYTTYVGIWILTFELG
jgi:hypothetical protein